MMEQAKEADKAYKAGTARPLEGVPFVMKDNIATNDAPCTAGCPALLDYVPKVDCYLWQILKENGAINAGKTNM
jgi:Asp-tRNA(Asn)/Glu-tRNA(Gln) amidotransferase A subunit family amidase